MADDEGVLMDGEEAEEEPNYNSTTTSSIVPAAVTDSPSFSQHQQFDTDKMEENVEVPLSPLAPTTTTDVQLPATNSNTIKSPTTPVVTAAPKKKSIWKMLAEDISSTLTLPTTASLQQNQRIKHLKEHNLEMLKLCTTRQHAMYKSVLDATQALNLPLSRTLSTTKDISLHMRAANEEIQTLVNVIQEVNAAFC